MDKMMLNKWDKNKKAQMEIIGLVIIVILITIGMLFMAQFALKDDKEKQVFVRKGLAYSTVSATLKTTIDENCAEDYGNPVFPQIGEDLLEDCALYHQNIAGSGYSEYSCNGQHSCIFLNNTISELLNQTVGEWGKRYEFQSDLIILPEGSRENLLLIKGRGGCKGRERDGSGPFTINTEYGFVETNLYVCD